MPKLFLLISLVPFLFSSYIVWKFFSEPDLAPVIIRRSLGFNLPGYKDGEGTVQNISIHFVTECGRRSRAHSSSSCILETECHANVIPVNKMSAGHDMITINTIPCRIKANERVKYIYRSGNIKRNAYIHPLTQKPDMIELFLYLGIATALCYVWFHSVKLLKHVFFDDFNDCETGKSYLVHSIMRHKKR